MLEIFFLTWPSATHLASEAAPEPTDFDVTIIDTFPPRPPAQESHDRGGRARGPPPRVAVMDMEQMLQLANAGGIASLKAPSAHRASDAPVTPKDLLSVSETAVLTLFGQPRAAILRIDDDPLQVEQRKDFKQRTAQAKEMISNGQSVPTGFCRPMLFWTFQFHRNGIVARSPILIRELTYWAWLFGRWAIKDPADMCNSGEFRDVLTSADAVGIRLAALAASIARVPDTPVPSMLRSELTHVLQRYSTVRLLYIRALFREAIDTPQLEPLHGDYRKILTAYERDHDTLPWFLKSVEQLVTTQSVSRGSAGAQEGYCTQAFLAWAQAFISSLRGGSAPAVTSTLDIPGPHVTDTAVSSLYSTAGSMTSSAITFSVPQAGNLAGPIVQPWLAQPPAIYTTIQQPTYSTVSQDHPPSGIFSLESMVRQTAAGYREAGPLFALGGGAVEGTDLPLTARRVLWAHQLASGTRRHGHLTATPPFGDLPPLSSYPVPYGPPPAAAHAPPPPPFGGAAPRLDFGGPRASARERNVDEVTIPFSATMLGSFTPYRAAKPSGNCFEGGRSDGHFGLECPVRFVRVKGEAPPGWRADGPGKASKNPAEWNSDLSELTDAARADYRTFIQRFALHSANLYPISADDIAGAHPPAPKRPAYSQPRGGGGARP